MAHPFFAKSVLDGSHHSCLFLASPTNTDSQTRPATQTFFDMVESIWPSCPTIQPAVRWQKSFSSSRCFNAHTMLPTVQSFDTHTHEPTWSLVCISGFFVMAKWWSSFISTSGRPGKASRSCVLLPFISCYFFQTKNKMWKQIQQTNRFVSSSKQKLEEFDITFAASNSWRRRGAGLYCDAAN